MEPKIKEKCSFTLSPISVVIPSVKERPEDRMKRLQYAQTLEKTLSTALKLIQYQKIQEKRAIRDKEIRKMGLLLKEKIRKENPNEFSRLRL